MPAEVIGCDCDLFLERLDHGYIDRGARAVLSRIKICQRIDQQKWNI